MPFADFDTATHPATQGTFIGGAEGSARFHSVLANPLAGEDLFCREFERTVQTTNGRGQFFMLNDPLFVGILSTKKVSLRAWVRRDGGAGTTMSLVARSGVAAGGNVNHQISGYLFGHGPGSANDSANTLIFSGYDAVANAGNKNEINGTGSGADVAEPAFQGYLDARWHKLRMDILPISDSADEIRLYTGTGATGSEIWTLLRTDFYSSADSWWVPHDHVTSNRYGFYIGNGNSGNSVYIDRFQIFVEDL